MKYFDIKPSYSTSLPSKSIPRRRGNFWRIFFLILGFLTLFLAIFAAFFGKNIKEAKDPTAVNSYQDFVVNSNENALTIAKNLKNQGLIKSQTVFVFYTLLSGEKNQLQSGTYYLSPSMSIGQIAFYIFTGRTKERRITIPEGLRLTEIAKKIEETKLATYAEFMEQVSEKSLWFKKYTFLLDKPQEASLEGYLFPDTYQFDKDTKISEIIETMLNNFDKKVDHQLRAQIQNSKKKLFEVLIIASIVEREAKFDEDRGKIASVFYNRLERGMKLEADPTIQYALGDWKAIKASDYQSVDSPYNTYKVNGLPPGPICNPGLKSIEAAINPAKTDYLYFFHLPDGATIYSKTIQEHEANRTKYQQ